MHAAGVAGVAGVADGIVIIGSQPLLGWVVGARRYVSLPAVLGACPTQPRGRPPRCRSGRDYAASTLLYTGAGETTSVASGCWSFIAVVSFGKPRSKRATSGLSVRCELAADAFSQMVRLA